MAATTATGFSPRAGACTSPIVGVQPRSRRITPEAGHALEILGHAIEYLQDEFTREGGDIGTHDGQVQAIQLLMSLNRQVYFQCPEILNFRDRIAGMFGRNLHI